MLEPSLSTSLYNLDIKPIFRYSFLAFSIAPVAQSVEQLPFKEMVVGSIPTGRTLGGETAFKSFESVFNLVL